MDLNKLSRVSDSSMIPAAEGTRLNEYQIKGKKTLWASSVIKGDLVTLFLQGGEDKFFRVKLVFKRITKYRFKLIEREVDGPASYYFPKPYSTWIGTEPGLEIYTQVE